MFLAKTFIAVSTTLIAYFILPPMTAPIEVDPTLPCVFVFLFSYFVAVKFIGIFETSANTILQCYLYDKDMEKHHGIDIKHVPPTLLKFLAIHGEENAKVIVVTTNASSIDQQNLMA